MVRKKQTPKGEEAKERSSTSRQRKAGLIKKRVENSSEALPSGDINASRLESFEQKASPPLDDFHAQIAIRAHELYQRRGSHHGQDLADWFDAERQVLSESQ